MLKQSVKCAVKFSEALFTHDWIFLADGLEVPYRVQEEAGEDLILLALAYVEHFGVLLADQLRLNSNIAILVVFAFNFHYTD